MPQPDRLDPNLFAYIWRHSRPQQLAILCVILVSLPFYFLALELPKSIINGPIQGGGFSSNDATQRLLTFSLTLPDWLGGKSLVIFDGVQLERWPYLVALCLVFLLLVVLNGAFKFWINNAKGRLGERMLRRLRYELVDRVLRFPASQFRRLKAPEVASMVKDEVDPLGGFIGDAFVAPALLLGQALTAAVFIYVQNFWLGALASLIVAIQIAIIPVLRRKLLDLGRRRQLAARELSGRVSEIVETLAQIRTNDTSNYERADISRRLAGIYDIRYEIYWRKYLIKFLNNFLAQLTPFFFFLVGGYFAIGGSLDVGQLLAVIVAYKDLPGPIKELIDWDQQRQDMQIKYDQVVEHFAPANMVDAEFQAASSGTVIQIEPSVEVADLVIDSDGAWAGVKRASFAIAPGERVAAVGNRQSGAEAVSEALVGLIAPVAGSIRIGGRDLVALPETVTGRRLAYIGEDTHLGAGSLRDCLLYGLKHFPAAVPSSGSESKLQRRFQSEANAAGNTTLDAKADWIDHATAGTASPEDLLDRIIDVLRLVDFDDDVFEIGLRSKLPETAPEIVKRVLEARAALREKLRSPELAGLVVPFGWDRYNSEATIAENLLLGQFIDPALSHDGLANNEGFRQALVKLGLEDALCRIGLAVARTAVELYADLAPEHPFLKQQSLLPTERLSAYKALVARVSKDGIGAASANDVSMIVRPALAYIEPRLRLGLIDASVMEQVLAARSRLRAALAPEIKRSIVFYDADSYNAALTLEDNILFGRVVPGIADGPRRVRQEIRSVLQPSGGSRFVHDIGLEFDVGVGGRHLSLAQRQKVGLARALLKRGDILVANRALASLGAKSQRAIMRRVLDGDLQSEARNKMTVLWVTANPATADMFDRVLVFEDGAIVEDGAPKELFQNDGAFKKLID